MLIQLLLIHSGHQEYSPCSRTYVQGYEDTHSIITVLMFKLYICQTLRVEKSRTMSIIYFWQRRELKRSGRGGEGRHSHIPSMQSSLSLFWIKPTPTQPPVAALICLALVTSFYPKGLQLLLPHYEQRFPFTNLWRRLPAIGDIVWRSWCCGLSVWKALNQKKNKIKKKLQKCISNLYYLE